MGMAFLFVVGTLYSILCANVGALTTSEDRGSSSVLLPNRSSGYINLNNTYDAHMFYWLFRSRSQGPNDPVVVWLHGGPGCSAALSIFYEAGPYRLSERLELEPFEFGWDVDHNMVYMDQPMNTGFSYSGDERDRAWNETVVADQMLQFLVQFMQEYPDLADRDLYITGVSYAGHMGPNIAHRIWQANKNGELAQPLNLKGVALGNPIINPAIQYTAYADYAFWAGLIDSNTQTTLNKAVPECERAIDRCYATGDRAVCEQSKWTCEVTTIGRIAGLHPGINIYDVKAPCYGPLCYDFSRLEHWINQDHVRNELGAGEHRWAGACSPKAATALIWDWVHNWDFLLVPMLEDGIRVLIYAGTNDLLCPWVGQERWLNALQWSGQAGFLGAQELDFAMNGRAMGKVRQHGSLAFVKVFQAGHEAPMDQPEAAQALYTRFTRSMSLSTGQPMGVEDQQIAQF